MKTQHTPGPWHSSFATVRRTGTPEIICDCHAGGEANARLIAAAPTLLEALAIAIDELKAIHSHHHPRCLEGCPTWAAIDNGRAAIAAATHEKNSQPATEVAH